MGHRILEIGKTILIVVLVCTLLLLFAASIPAETVRENHWLSQLLQPFAGLLGQPQAELTYVETALPVLDAAQPVVISVCNSAGRSTAMWDFAALDAAFETYGGLLGQALDTASVPEQVPQAQARQALTGTGVYFRYGWALPGTLLASWLGARPAVELPDADVYLLAAEKDGVALYLLGDGSWRAGTDLSAQTLETLLEQVYPDGSRLALEADSHLDPLTILPPDNPAAAEVTASTPVDARYIESLANELGFNPYSETRFTDSDGVTYLNEGSSTLEISTAGALLLTCDGTGRFAAPVGNVPEQVELGRQLVELAAGSLPDTCRLYLSGLEQNGTETVCTFDYLISGMPVILPGRSAAVLTFSEVGLTRMEMQVYAFGETGTVLYPLPVAQAMAVLPKGAELALQYGIGADQSVTMGWRQ